jgi:hypothetical protein
MNLFARTLGGILSDYWAKSFAMRGRLWAHFIATFGSAVGCFALGLVTDDLGWPIALLMVFIFSIFINMAEGTAYGIVPFMQPKNLGVVSGLVGAGGTAGGVLCTASFYGPGTHPLDSLKLHALYIFVTSVTVPFLTWPQFGSMFSAPADDEKNQRECCSPAKKPQQLSPENSPKNTQERKESNEAEIAESKEKAAEMAKKMAKSPKTQEANAEVQEKLKAANDEIAQLKSELETLRTEKKAELDLGESMAGNQDMTAAPSAKAKVAADDPDGLANEDDKLAGL